MFQIKICGITTPEDALLAADAGADAIGLNFYEKSPRFVRDAQQICASVSGKIARVGVFVNPSLPALKQTLAETPLAAIQLHGDEPAELLEEIALLARSVIYQQLPVIRAFRCSLDEIATVSAYLGKLAVLQCPPAAVLLDAYDPSAFGGTGKSLDWDRLASQRSTFAGQPLILAGGLTPDNVARAIAAVRPEGVDVASGVESSPGKKDPAKVRDFVAAAKEAFAKLAGSAREQ
jgi:phosphoribosylanthranilate isomerase